MLCYVKFESASKDVLTDRFNDMKENLAKVTSIDAASI